GAARPRQPSHPPAGPAAGGASATRAPGAMSVAPHPPPSEHLTTTAEPSPRGVSGPHHGPLAHVIPHPSYSAVGARDQDDSSPPIRGETFVITAVSWCGARPRVRVRGAARG